jgi:hypothetical protein
MRPASLLASVAGVSGVIVTPLVTAAQLTSGP